MGEIFMMIPEKALADLSVMTVTDLLQLPRTCGKLIFSQIFDKDSIKHLLILPVGGIYLNMHIQI